MGSIGFSSTVVAALLEGGWDPSEPADSAALFRAVERLERELPQVKGEAFLKKYRALLELLKALEGD